MMALPLPAGTQRPGPDRSGPSRTGRWFWFCRLVNQTVGFSWDLHDNKAVNRLLESPWCPAETWRRANRGVRRLWLPWKRSHMWRSVARSAVKESSSSINPQLRGGGAAWETCCNATLVLRTRTRTRTSRLVKNLPRVIKPGLNLWQGK